MAFLEIATIAVLTGRYIYHRLTESDPRPPSERINPPKQNEGAPVPLVFGRCRVRRPVIAWSGGQTGAVSAGPTGFTYSIKVLYVVGIPVWQGTTMLHGVFVGDVRADGLPLAVPPNLGGTLYLIDAGELDSTDTQFWQAELEFGDGDAAQDMATGTAAAGWMTTLGSIDANNIPGFRGLITIGADFFRFTPDLGPFEPEVSSYPFEQRYTAVIPTKIGDDMNPADVIAAVLCDQLGKLGLDPDEVIDAQSFKKAGETLLAEGLGYSRCFDDRTPARDIINDVLRTVDGVLYERRDTGRYVFKLIRPDYDPAAVLVVHPSNCSAIEDLDATGWTDTPSSVRVVFTDRENGYRENSAAAGDLASASIQDGEPGDLVLDYPGLCTKEAAELVAGRELEARSRPLLRCRAVVDRRFWETNIGDVVRLNGTWSDLTLSNRYMRVGNVGFGTADSNMVVLDLIEDFAYVRNKKISTGGTVAPFPTQASTVG